MKEINVRCNLYLECEDDESVEEVLDRLLMMIDFDVKINVHEYKLQHIFCDSL